VLFIWFAQNFEMAQLLLQIYGKQVKEKVQLGILKPHTKFLK